MLLAIQTKFWELAKESKYEFLLLFVSIVVAGWLIGRIRSRFRDNEDPAVDEQRMLLQVKDLHRQGDLSDDEYRSIKSQLIERVDGFSRAED